MPLLLRDGNLSCAGRWEPACRWQRGLGARGRGYSIPLLKSVIDQIMS